MTEAGSTEEELVLKSQNGDRAAFEALMTMTIAMCWALAWRLTGNQGDMEDLVQETHLKAWIAIPKFRAQSKFSSWLHSIEFNCYMDRKRKQGKLREVSLDCVSGDGERPVMQIADPSPGAPAQMEASERASSIRKALDSLRPEYKQILIMREQEGFSQEEIGAVMHIPKGTVSTWLTRARADLREAYLKAAGEKL